MPLPDIDPNTGIEVNIYGSHIFHPSSEDVWEFRNRFTSFNNYRHRVLANYKGRIYHLPIGKKLYKEFFGEHEVVENGHNGGHCEQPHFRPWCYSRRHVVEIQVGGIEA